MTDEFDKGTAETVRVFAVIVAGVLAALLAMFLWGVGHRALEEYDRWACARTCAPNGIESLGGYNGCECQKLDARETVENEKRLREAKELIDDLLRRERAEP